MRKVVYGINLTADGCCDHTKGNGTPDIHVYFTDLYKDVDLIVYGRKTYELMVPFWPDVAKSQSGSPTVNAFALAFDAIDKVVFSKTLQQAGANTRIVREDLAGEIARLKQQPGKDISIGGVDLPCQLIALGLVDEFHFVVQPYIAGEGRRLMDGTFLPEQLNLKLVAFKPLESGAMALHYTKQ
ncbi:dihydrofolate reductase family protein [Chitinophaga pollutisoli]|uniref:Dihydrofolate reductase family protein n=1 Tax=Chitinophaga pollutisoli TaxID=3133966 RepID=A0ABZ2YNC8_9BACT